MKTKLERIAEKSKLKIPYRELWQYCESNFEERSAGNPHATICGGCALKALVKLRFEISALAKPSQQLNTESCVVNGNRHCEA